MEQKGDVQSDAFKDLRRRLAAMEAAPQVCVTRLGGDEGDEEADEQV